MKIFYSKWAEKSITKLIEYLIEIGYPTNAGRYKDKIEKFIEELANNYKVYGLCKRETWAKRKLHCAVFDSKYIIAFKIVDGNFRIYHFMHGSQIK